MSHKRGTTVDKEYKWTKDVEQRHYDKYIFLLSEIHKLGPDDPVAQKMIQELKEKGVWK